MKATCWHGVKDVRIDNVPDPEILNPHDAIIEVKKSAICGSDLHLYHGYIPTMKKGDVLGHEFCGEVVAVGSEVKKAKVGDRVVVPFTISCGTCHYCSQGLFALCDNTNPNGALQKKMIGYPTAGLYGYSHGYGGYAGGQSQFVRVPFADTDTLQIPEGLSYEQALFLSDIYPTGFMAADNCNIRPGDTVAIWGCGPVAQFAIKSALMLGAGRVIAIDRWQYRLDMAAQHGATVLNYEEVDVLEALEELTGGLGPNSVIDAVGMEAHGDSIDAVYDEAAQKLKVENDRSHALRQAIKACGKGGTVSIPGVYSGLVDKFPLGVAFAKGLTFKMGQTHMQKYMGRCMELIVEGKIDTTSVISHRISLDDVPQAYDTFAKKEDNAMKYVLTP